jgi:hypothetical protein
MPMVGGKEYPYTEKGKKAAKKAAVAMKTGSKKKAKRDFGFLLPTKKQMKSGPKKAKNSFSGANSQIGSSY